MRRGGSSVNLWRAACEMPRRAGVWLVCLLALCSGCPDDKESKQRSDAAANAGEPPSDQDAAADDDEPGDDPPGDEPSDDTEGGNPDESGSAEHDAGATGAADASATSEPRSTDADSSASTSTGAVDPSDLGDAALVAVPANDGSVGEAAIGHPDELEAVMGEYFNTTGYDFTPTVDVRPVVLFKDGFATLSTNVLYTSFDLAADRAKLPANWFAWRTVEGKTQIQRGSKWLVLDDVRFPPFAKGATINGDFERLSGSGAVAVVKTYSFRDDGSYSYRGSSTLGSVTTERGTYELENYRVQIKLTNGSGWTSSLVHYPKTKTIYLGGTSYTDLD